MERDLSIQLARKIMGENFIGPEELALIISNLPLDVPLDVPKIPYDEEFLEKVKEDHILLLAVATFQDGTNISIQTLRDKLGVDPDKKEPCFYNQDWYLNEEFIKRSLKSGWCLVRKKILLDFRGINPENIPNFLANMSNSFVPAVLLTYLFFVWFFFKNEALWMNEYIWCEDFDKKGDRIYVGRYYDVASMKRIGFEIHRHLKIKSNYSVLSYYNTVELK